MEIESIVGPEPVRPDEFPVVFKVGFGGVTRIEQVSHSEHPCCESYSFQVWGGDFLLASIPWHGVIAIYYQ